MSDRADTRSARSGEDASGPPAEPTLGREPSPGTPSAGPSFQAGDEIDGYRLLEPLPALAGELAVPLYCGEELATGDPVLIAPLAAGALQDSQLDSIYDRSLRFAQLEAPRSRHPRWPVPAPAPLLASSSPGLRSVPAYLCWRRQPGRTLRARLRLHYPDMAEALGIVLAAAQGLASIHASGELHGALCPANLLLGNNGQTGLLAPGIALLIMPIETDPEGGAGYRAPEQLPGGYGPIGPATDVFSLGVLLFELIECDRPFHASTAEDLRIRIERHSPLPLTGSPGAPKDEIQEILNRALDPDPLRRFRMAADMVEPLVRLLDGIDPVAPTISPALGTVPRKPERLLAERPRPESESSPSTSRSNARPDRGSVHTSSRRQWLEGLRLAGVTSSVPRLEESARVDSAQDPHFESPSLLRLWLGPGILLAGLLALALWFWLR